MPIYQDKVIKSLKLDGVEIPLYDAPPVLQEKNVTSNGTVLPDSGYDGLSKVNVDVTVPTETKTVDLAMSSGNQVVNATSGKFMTSVTVNKPATMLSENIKKDVNIGGVVGTFEGSGGGNANIEYTSAEGWNDTQLILNKTFTKYGSYGFVYDSTYGLKPQNQGVNNSFAMCKIPFTISNPCNITVNMYQGSEVNFDYGFLSKLDTELGQNYNTTDSNCVDVGAGTSGSKGKSGDFSYTFSNVSAGLHYITIKYRKDSSTHTSPDLFSVKSIVASVAQGTKSKTWVDSGEDIDIVRWADESIPTPTGNIQLSQQTGTDVTNYATASVRSGSVTINTPTVSSSGLITASASVGTAGWIDSNPSSATKQLSTQGAKTVTPSSSSQTAVSSGVYTTGDITVAAVPTETKNITVNGTYTPTSGKFFSSVTVNVSGGGGGSKGGDYNISQVIDENGKSSLAIFDAPNKNGAYNIIQTVDGDESSLAIVDAEGVTGLMGIPIEVSTDEEMATVLTLENLGKCYKFTGTSSTYVTGDLYVVEAV